MSCSISHDEFLRTSLDLPANSNPDQPLEQLFASRTVDYARLAGKCRSTINTHPPFKGLNIRIPSIIPVNGRCLGFHN